MRFLTPALLLTALILFNACKPKETLATAVATTSDVAKEVVEAEQVIEEQVEEVISRPEKRFMAGIVEAGVEGSACEFVIVSEELRYKLDASNLSDEYKQDQLEVLFKYHTLRVQDRCPEAIPVFLEEIKLRGE